MQSKIVCVILFLFQGLIICNGQINVLYTPDCLQYNFFILGKLVVQEFGEGSVDSMLNNKSRFYYQIEINSKGIATSAKIIQSRNFDKKLLVGLSKKIMGRKFYYCSDGMANTPKAYRELQKEFALKNQPIIVVFPAFLTNDYIYYKSDVKKKEIAKFSLTQNT